MRWISIVSSNPIVTFNVFLHDLFAGLKVKEAILLYDDTTERFVNRLVPGIKKVYKIWTNSSLTISALKIPSHPLSLEDSLKDIIGHGDCINITPGRKVQALALYKIGLEHRCDVRYHFIRFEKRFGYKPFPLTPLMAIEPLSLTLHRVLEWNPPTPSKCDEHVEVGVNGLTGLTYLLLEYAGNDIDIKCNGVGVKIDVDELDFNVKVIEQGYGREVRVDDIVQALYVSHVVKPSNFNELLTIIGDCLRHGYRIVFDTNAYINRLYTLIYKELSDNLKEVLRESVDVLSVVYNELSDFDRFRSGYGLSIEGRKKLIGLWELLASKPLIRLHPGFERARGDARIVDEIAKSYGVKPKVLLVTFDKALSLKAKPRVDTFLTMYTDVREARAPIEYLPELLFYLTIIAGEVMVNWGKFRFKIKGFWHGKDPSRRTIRIVNNTHVQWIARNVKETLSITENIIKP